MEKIDGTLVYGIIGVGLNTTEAVANVIENIGDGAIVATGSLVNGITYVMDVNNDAIYYIIDEKLGITDLEKAHNESKETTNKIREYISSKAEDTVSYNISGALFNNESQKKFYNAMESNEILKEIGTTCATKAVQGINSAISTIPGGAALIALGKIGASTEKVYEQAEKAEIEDIKVEQAIIVGGVNTMVGIGVNSFAKEYLSSNPILASDDFEDRVSKHIKNIKNNTITNALVSTRKYGWLVYFS